MGKCARRTKRGIKAIAKSLTPVGIKLIGNIVGLVAKTEWDSATKRRTAYELAKENLKAAGIEAKGAAIRATTELMVAGLEDGVETLKDFGEVDPADAQEIEDLDGDGLPG